METKEALKQFIEYVEYDYDVEEMPSKTAMDMALEALEKQIPKEATDNGHGVKFCPICHGSVWQIKLESKYCFRCGQALKWD